MALVMLLDDLWREQDGNPWSALPHSNIISLWRGSGYSLKLIPVGGDRIEEISPYPDTLPSSIQHLHEVTG